MPDALFETPLYLVPLIPAFGALLVALVGWSSCALRRWLMVLVLLANLAFLVPIAVLASPLSARLGPIQLAGQRLDVALRLDGLALPLLLLVSLGSLLIAVYVALDPTYRAFGTRTTAMLLLAVSATNATLIAGDLFLLYACLMLASMFVFLFLIGEPGLATRQAAFKLFATVEVAALSLPVVVVTVLGNGGASDLAKPIALGGSGLLASALLLAIVARAGIVPVHTWLIDALESARPRSAAFVALLSTPLGVYLIVRLGPVLSVAGFPFAAALLVLGSITLVVAAYLALHQTSPVRVVAAVTLAQAGCVALSYASGGPLALEATLAQMVAMLLLGPLCFMALEALSPEGRISSVPALAAAFARRPYAGLIFALALLAAAGLPPFYGFVARDYVLRALLANGGFAFFVSALIFLATNGVLLSAAASLTAKALLSEPVVEASAWWRGRRAPAVLLSLFALPIAVLTLAPVPLHQALVGQALTGPVTGSSWGALFSGALLVVALFGGAWPFLASGKLPSVPSLAVALEARLRPQSNRLDRFSRHGALDLYNIVTVVIFGIARGIALVIGAVLDRLAN